MVDVVFVLLKDNTTKFEGRGTMYIHVTCNIIYIFHVIVSEYIAVNITKKVMHQWPPI